uniref:tRNA wybutosine-synthesizing protein 3 homolog n=1 Tax=Geotrypetes seraphini TaxID=260995 RepID=A0A6P8P8F3_GEOSA|nr:tRNA wybutosine-synthesizing protein 3 homolog isoform X2 [Geotrypetes seraphini]
MGASMGLKCRSRIALGCLLHIRNVKRKMWLTFYWQDVWKMLFNWAVTNAQLRILLQIAALQKSSGDAVLKFEPFVLHVQCRQLQDAQLLHSVALSSGFRNSGITVGKKGRTMMAVRSTHGLEVPLSRKGKLLVNEEYIEFLVQIANQKMEENKKRTDRFYSCLQSALRCEDIFEKSILESQTSRPVYTRRRRRKGMKEDVVCTSPDEEALDGEEEVEFDAAIFSELHL